MGYAEVDMAFIVIAFFSVPGLLCYVFWKLLSRIRIVDLDNELEALVETFSAEKYRRIEPILCWAEDLAFLEAEPGYYPGIGRALLADRKRIVRAYARELRRDFERLYGVGELILLHSPEDQPELARTLARLKLSFYRSFLRLECELVLHSMQIPAAPVRRLAVDFENLIGYVMIARQPS